MAAAANRTLLLARIVLLALLNARCGAGTSPGIVAELTDEYFDEGLVYYNFAMVLFYARHCVHCSEFMPTFNMAADALIRNEPPVHAAMVNCADAGKAVCRQEDINHLPTIRIYRKATLYDEYDGARDVESLVTYMKKLVGITSTELSPDALDSFVNAQKEVTIVAVLSAKGNLRDHYFSLPAELSKDIRFGHVTIDIEEEAHPHGVTLWYPEHMRTKFEPWQYTYNLENEGHDLLEFILKHRYGIAGVRGVRHVDDFAPPLVIIYLRFDINLKAKMFAYWRNRILKVAKNYHHVLNFAISPIDDFQNEFAKFGIPLPSEDKLDTPLVFAILADNTKYLLEEDFSIDVFDAFLNRVVNGTADPHLKSQPIPEGNGARGTVQAAVAKNFKEIVFDDERDVLLELFAPWCTYCKALSVVLDDLAQLLADEDITIVKVDATENEIPAMFETPRFPTVYFLRKSDKSSAILYESDSNLNNLLSFIAEHSTDELRNFDRAGERKQIERTEL